MTQLVTHLIENKINQEEFNLAKINTIYLIQDA